VTTSPEPLLDLSDLWIEVRAGEHPLWAVAGANLSVDSGETLGLVGESGCGKSMTALAVMRLLPPAARVVRGSIRWCGEDLLALSESAMRRCRGRDLGMVFQDPMSSLNPVRTVGDQVAEAFRVARGMGRTEARQAAVTALEEVGLAAGTARTHPHELSGGMQQRAMIAIALAGQPKLLIADEPTTALDVTIQAEILELFWRLREERRMGVLFITHDLSLLAEHAHRLVVMYAGQDVESGPLGRVTSSPIHPYTVALLACRPRFGGRHRRLPAVPGSPPRLTGPPRGCPFAPRCPRVTGECSRESPPLFRLAPDHWARCFHP